MTNPTLNQVYANSAQVVDIPKALETAEFLLKISNIFIKEGEQDLINLWRFRAYCFLNRACELECVPVHSRVIETYYGTEEAWFSYLPVSDFKELFRVDHTILIGYCSVLTESQARMRALS